MSRNELSSRNYSMFSFTDYIATRESLLAVNMPGITRPSSKVPSCRDYTRRLVRKFRPRVTKRAPLARQRPRMSPMT